MNYTLKRFLLIIGLGLLLSCVNHKHSTNTPPFFLNGTPYNWIKSSPSKQGLTKKYLRQAYREVKNMHYVNSLLIVKNDFLVFEEYFNGYNKNALEMTHSVTKSITSALIGLVIRDGYIESLDQNIIDFFPENKFFHQDSMKRKITIRHLLAMQSGFDKEENLSEKMSPEVDVITTILNSELKFVPGSEFLYSTHGSHLLSNILTIACGKSAHEYAQEKLFYTIGIQSSVWLKDEKNINYGGSGLYLTPRDMARFGYLYLNNGMVDSVQILPDEWITNSTQNYRDYVNDWKEMKNVGYGLHWWTGEIKDYSLFFASGYGGQCILVVPELDLIIVSTMNASTDRNWNQMESLIKIINDYIIPSVVL